MSKTKIPTDAKKNYCPKQIAHASNQTMAQLSYGIKQPRDLLEKLKLDAEKLTSAAHPYDVFNFIITAAVLAEWIEKFYSSQSDTYPFSIPSKNNRWSWLIPSIAPQWINDTSCIPNPHINVIDHIRIVLAICKNTANASKHFEWNNYSNVSAINNDPLVGDFYDYCFTSTEADIYIRTEDKNYGLKQIKGIILQFYSGLISYLEDRQNI